MDFDEWVKGLQETEDGRVVYRAASVDKSGESGIIKKSHRLAEEKEFSFDDYDNVINPKSVQRFEKTAKKLGYEYVRGIDKLTDGRAARIILRNVDKLSKQYGKRFSSVIIMDFGDEKTIAESFLGELRLNSKFMNKPDAMRDVLNKWEKDNFIPTGCNSIQYVSKHEYFHLLYSDDIDNTHSKINTLIRRYKDNGGKPVSTNSVKNDHEFISDLLCSFSSDDNKIIKLKESVLKLKGG